MTEYELGREGEQQARLLLKAKGFVVQSPDWLAKKDGEWTCFEIKKKERFLAPPFDGHGLDERQIKLRQMLLEDKGIRTMLMIFEVPTNQVYAQYIDKLYEGEWHQTKNNIFIFPLSSYERW